MGGLCPYIELHGWLVKKLKAQTDIHDKHKYIINEQIKSDTVSRKVEVTTVSKLGLIT